MTESSGTTVYVPKSRAAEWLKCQQSLRQVLSQAGHPEVLHLETNEKVPAQHVLLMCKHTEFVYNRTAKVIRWIRPVKRSPVWQKCWRTSASSVLPITDEYGRPTEWRVHEGEISTLDKQLGLGTPDAIKSRRHSRQASAGVKRSGSRKL